MRYHEPQDCWFEHALLPLIADTFKQFTEQQMRRQVHDQAGYNHQRNEAQVAGHPDLTGLIRFVHFGSGGRMNAALRAGDCRRASLASEALGAARLSYVSRRSRPRNALLGQP